MARERSLNRSDKRNLGALGGKKYNRKSKAIVKTLDFPPLVVQSLSHVQFFVTLWTAAHQASLSFTISQSLLKLTSIESVMPSNHLILCRFLLHQPSIFPSFRVSSNESVLCIRWPKCWSFSFSISPSNEYSGLISFRIDWLDLFAVQGILKSLLQHHNSKAPSFWVFGIMLMATAEIITWIVLCFRTQMCTYSKETMYGNKTRKKYGKILIVVVSRKGNYGWFFPLVFFLLVLFCFCLIVSISMLA